MRTKEREKRKSHNGKGFTLAETLLAVLILLMVSTIVATGIPVAKNAYEKVIISSNAEVLLSTAVSTLRNELGTAKDVKVTDADDLAANVLTGTSITYYNPVRESRSRIFRANGSSDKDSDNSIIPAGTIMLHRYYDESGLHIAGTGSAARLVSKEAATEKLYVTFSSVEYHKLSGVITFRNISVSRQGGVTDLTQRNSVSIRLISFEEE